MFGCEIFLFLFYFIQTSKMTSKSQINFTKILNFTVNPLTVFAFHTNENTDHMKNNLTKRKKGFPSERFGIIFLLKSLKSIYVSTF